MLWKEEADGFSKPAKDRTERFQVAADSSFRTNVGFLLTGKSLMKLFKSRAVAASCRTFCLSIGGHTTAVLRIGGAKTWKMAAVQGDAGHLPATLQTPGKSTPTNSDDTDEPILSR